MGQFLLHLSLNLYEEETKCYESGVCVLRIRYDFIVDAVAVRKQAPRHKVSDPNTGFKSLRHRSSGPRHNCQTQLKGLPAERNATPGVCVSSPVQALPLTHSRSQQEPRH